MNEKEDLNLTIPIILLGILTIGLLVFFNISVSDSGKVSFSGSMKEVVDNNLTASVVHFTAPDRVVEGGSADFSWKADVDEGAICVGKTEPEGSDGGWIGLKDIEGAQMVGPIELNTTYFLDCTDGERMVRDVELVAVVKPKISFLATNNSVNFNEKVELSWDAINVNECSLYSDDVLLAQDLNGSYQTGNLERTTIFTLSCISDAETISEVVEIVVK